MDNTMTQYTRFELEDALNMACSTADDLGLLYQQHSDRAVPYTEDEISNRLYGLHLIHVDRMERVMEIYNSLVEQGVII